ncbi:hypothetical protein SISNIDRAFT_549152, partial [Sistotremastrum niveocremeum HHB9708]
MLYHMKKPRKPAPWYSHKWPLPYKPLSKLWRDTGKALDAIPKQHRLPLASTSKACQLCHTLLSSLSMWHDPQPTESVDPPSFNTIKTHIVLGQYGLHSIADILQKTATLLPRTAEQSHLLNIPDGLPKLLQEVTKNIVQALQSFRQSLPRSEWDIAPFDQLHNILQRPELLSL